jgi:hypothetical protein
MTTNERPAVMIVPRFTALGASYFDRGRLLPLAEVLALLNAQEGLRAALVQEHSYVWSKPVEWCNVCKLLTATALLQPAAQEVT